MRGIFLLCVLHMSLIAHAQQPARDTARILNEVVVSVNRWEENAIEIPNRVTKVSAAEIQLQNPQTAADLLGLSNQVFIQKSQLGGGSPMIRGFATNRVLLVVDGVRMNNAIFRSGNVQNVISLDANAVENAEVIFGPGSVIYGSDAIGGVMDFHTLVPRLSAEEKPVVFGNALVRYASANEEKTMHADVNVGFEKWSVLSSITFSDYNHLKQGSHGPEEYIRSGYVVRENGSDVVKPNVDTKLQVPSGYSQLNTLNKIRFRPSPAWDLSYGYHYSKTSSYDRYDRLVLKNSAGNFVSAEWYYGPQQWTMHHLQASYLNATRLFDIGKLTLAFQTYEESRHNRNFGSANRNNRFEKVRAFSANLDFDKKINSIVHVFYGLEAITNRVNSSAYRLNINTEVVSPLATRYPDGSVWRSFAGYVSSKFRLSEKVLATMSGRLTHVYTHAEFSSSFFPFPFSEALLKNTSGNGSLGFVYTPSQSWKIFSNYATGFRAPNIDDIGKVFDSQPGNIVVPNPALKPEYAQSVELGTAGLAGRNLKIDFGIYYTRMNNAIARAPSTFNGQDSIDYDGMLSRVLALQNISTLYVYGVQAGFEWSVNNMIQLTSSINYQKGKEKDIVNNLDFSPAHVAPLFGATHIVARIKKWRADLYANYNGEISFENLSFSERGDAHLYAKDNNGNPYALSWWTLNLKASFALNKHITFDAGVENIFDKRYRPYASGISAPGRNIIVSLRGKI